MLRGRGRPGEVHVPRLAGRQARPAQWPTSDEIEGAFGTWSAATEFARNCGIAGAACAARLTATGGHYDADAVIACVSEWAPTVSGPLAFDAYRQWARERMLDPGRARDRYFRTRRPVNRLFGSWEALLMVIGLGDRCANACPSPAQTEERREQAVFWPRVSWRAAGWDGWLTQSAHHGFVRAVQAKRKARGLPLRWLPWAVDVNEMFGSWASGLLAAGLISSKVHAARDGARTPVRSDEELLDWVVAATRERRRSWRSMTGQGYKRWLRGRRADGDARPPSYETVSRRFGNSSQAVMRRAAGRARQVRQAGAA